MDAERAFAEKIPLLFAVDQRPFKFQKDTGPVNRFCVLYPLMAVTGERLKADNETFPHRGRVWWKLRDEIREDMVVPGSLWTGTLEPARGSGRGRADDDVYQVSLRDIYPASGDLVEILTVKEDDPDLDRILQELPLPWPEPVTSRVILQGWRTMLGPLRATWRPETQDIVFAPLSALQPEVLSMPIKEFFENTRTERFQIELNAFDPQSDLNRRAILLTRMDWLNLDKLRKVGRVLDCSTDSQVVSWALGYLGLSRSQAQPLKQVLTEVQQRQLSFNGELESRKLERFQQIAQQAERVVSLGADVAHTLAETPAFGELVSMHVVTAAEGRINEIVTRRREEIDAAVQDKQHQLAEVQAQLDQLGVEYDRRAAVHEEELRQRNAERLRAIDEREQAVVLRQRFLDEQQNEFLARFRAETEGAAAAVLAQLPLLRALGLGEHKPDVNAQARADFVPLRLPAFQRTPKPTDGIIAEEEFIAQLGRLSETKGLHFTSEDLINFHVCMKLGGLPVVVGRSGIGKNRLPRLYAEALGCADEFLHVPVPTHREENFSLFGEYNAVAQRFEPGDSGLLEHLIAAAVDQREGRGGIYTICLDQMSFGRIESSFSHLLHALELPASERRLTLFGRGLTRVDDPYTPYHQLPLGDNLRFTAIVDTHEAIGCFSPKMLDRCQIVALTAPDFKNPPGCKSLSVESAVRPVTATTYSTWVRAPKTEGATYAFLLEIHSALKPVCMGLGYRQIDRVLGYVESAQPIFTADTALDFQLQQVILPRLRPSAPHFAASVQALVRLVPVERFPRSAELLTRILESQSENDYFRLL
jgi:hypothetical protein